LKKVTRYLTSKDNGVTSNTHNFPSLLLIITIGVFLDACNTREHCLSLLTVSKQQEMIPRALRERSLSQIVTSKA